MIISLFGESCTGKTLIAKELSKIITAEVFTGKDYIRLSKNEADARKIFSGILIENEKSDKAIIYIISEREHLALLPEISIRILITADIDVIKERFAKRLNGSMSPAVAAMLEKKHGIFDSEKHDLHIISGEKTAEESCGEIIRIIKEKQGEVD